MYKPHDAVTKYKIAYKINPEKNAATGHGRKNKAPPNKPGEVPAVTELEPE